MAERKELTPTPARRDPIAALRQMTSELDRFFDEPFWTSFRWPALRGTIATEGTWAPKIDVFEQKEHLVARVDLPGVKRDDVTVEVHDGHLVIAGERTQEKEEKKDNVYRIEREYGSFQRVIPLPEGARLDEVAATFDNGVLEVRVPLPERRDVSPRRIQIDEPGRSAKSAA